jgi:hypothetical protein
MHWSDFWRLIEQRGLVLAAALYYPPLPNRPHRSDDSRSVTEIEWGPVMVDDELQSHKEQTKWQVESQAK